MYPVKKTYSYKFVSKIWVPLTGFAVTGLFTYLLFASLDDSIKKAEQLISVNIKDRLALEFEWRMTERHTSVFLEFINSNVTQEQYREISQPSLDTAIGSSTSIGWCPRVRPDEREDFVRKAKEEYFGDIDYEITVGNGEGDLFPRFVDDEDIYPLLYSNPITLTYTGLDFRFPNHPIDAAIETGQPVTTNKVILDLFGGLSQFVDENYEPINEEENPISFIVFHAVYDQNGNATGVIGNTFEPRGFISSIVNSFDDLVDGMEVLVFRRRTFYGLDHELFFDLKGGEESNPESTVTIENSLERGRNSYRVDYVSETTSVDLVIILTSTTTPDPIKYIIMILIGFLFTMGIWYVNHHLWLTSLINIKLSRAKSKFLAEMSHELRTPLNGILGMSDLLEAESLTNSGGECIGDLKTCGSILLGTISEVLDFSKIEAGKIQMNTRRVDIRDFCVNTMRIMKFYRTYHERKEEIKLKLYVDKSVPRMVVSDFDKIGKIIMNFVGNSLKFTEHGYVSLNVYWDDNISLKKTNTIGETFLSRQEGERIGFIRLVIKDTGRGMSAKNISNIFQPFQQVQLGRASEGGTGLGLVISKSFAENMGGMIKCESELNIGTTFTTWVRVKIDPREGQYVRGDIEEEWTIGVQEREDIVSISNKKEVILVVDDVYLNLRMMGKLLNSMGISFHMASSGEQAVQMCMDFKYDLILLDYFMGGMTGIESAIEIRKKGINSLTSIIILTANEYDEDLEKSGLGYIQKPVNKEILTGIIKK